MFTETLRVNSGGLAVPSLSHNAARLWLDSKKQNPTKNETKPLNYPVKPFLLNPLHLKATQKTPIYSADLIKETEERKWLLRDLNLWLKELRSSKYDVKEILNYTL